MSSKRLSFLKLKKRHSLEQLIEIINGHKQKGEKVVLANGCFDLIHVGHIRYLKESRDKGDVLVVALNSDTSVRTLKGKGRPILQEKEREEIISSFYFVDYVTFFDELNVEKILLALKPDIHAKGSDYTEDTVPEKETVKKYGGTIAITGGPKIKSTSQLIEEIASKLEEEE
jgi:rfaE bifunctional protein nucleotidyltransferase chain/domain